MDQPEWWVESLAWFLPRYDQVKFAMRAKAILGDGKKKGRDGPVGKLKGSQPRRASGGGNNRQPAG